MGRLRVLDVVDPGRMGELEQWIAVAGLVCQTQPVCFDAVCFCAGCGGVELMPDSQGGALDRV